VDAPGPVRERLRARYAESVFEEVHRVEVLEHPVVLRPGIVEPEVDEAAARRSLRDQISRLEREMGAAVCAAYPKVPAPKVSARRAGPRVLGLGDLEALRDELADSLRGLRGDLSAQAERQQAARLLIEKMLLAPAEHKWVRVSNADLGQPGCKHWHVRPRLGLIGMLAGWWHVKISSGCPLAGGPRRSPRPRSTSPDGEAHTPARGGPRPA